MRLLRFFVSFCPGLALILQDPLKRPPACLIRVKRPHSALLRASFLRPLIPPPFGESFALSFVVLLFGEVLSEEVPHLFALDP